MDSNVIPRRRVANSREVGGRKATRHTTVPQKLPVFVGVLVPKFINPITYSGVSQAHNTIGCGSVTSFARSFDRSSRVNCHSNGLAICS